MHYELKFEPQFKRDYKQFKRQYPELISDLLAAFDLLVKTGHVTAAYAPHLLNNKGGNYNHLLEFHLSDGKVDVLVIYKPYRTNPAIRLIRIGPHEQLFQGQYR